MTRRAPNHVRCQPGGSPATPVTHRLTAGDLLRAGECDAACLLAGSTVEACTCKCNGHYHGELRDALVFGMDPVNEVPALYARWVGDKWSIWCVHCKWFHFHYDVGHCAAACTEETSPYLDTGYVLITDGRDYRERGFDALDNVHYAHQ